MSGNIVTGAAVSVNATSSVGSYFSGITRENVSKFFSTWSGRGMEYVRNVPVQMQQSNKTAFGVFIGVNLVSLAIVKAVFHPQLERHLEEKNDDTKSQWLSKRLTKVLVVGAFLTAVNFAFAKLAKYPLTNIGLYTAVATALIGYLVFVKPSSIHRPETPAQRAARLADEATQLEGTATAAETTAQTAAQTLADRTAELTAARNAVTQAEEALNAARTAYARAQQELQDAEVAIPACRQAALEASNGTTQAQTRLAAAREALTAEEATVVDLAQLRQTLEDAQQAEATAREDLAAARDAEASARAELETAQQNQAADHDAAQDNELAEAVRLAGEAVTAAEQARQQVNNRVIAAEQDTVAARVPLQQVLDLSRALVTAETAANEAAQRAQQATEALEAANARLQAAEQVVNHPVNVAPLEQALNERTATRATAEEAVTAATTANTQAQEAAQAARVTATAARDAATAAAVPAAPATT